MPGLDAQQLRDYSERIHHEARTQLERLPAEKAVHQLRLCTKRLRAIWQLLAIADPILSKQRQRQLNLLAKQLADQRDLDVRRNWLKKLCPDALDLLPPRARRPRARLNALSQSVLRQQLALDLGAWRQTPLEQLIEGHQCTRRKGRKLCQKLGPDSPAEHYHRLRKWAKYLQYQQELLQQEDLRIAALTKSLGDKHDLDLLQEWLEALDRRCRTRQQVLKQRLADTARGKRTQRHRRQQLEALKTRHQLIRHARRQLARQADKLQQRALRQARALYLEEAAPAP